MILFYSNAKYSNGVDVNTVLQSLQAKYGFVDKFEEYIMLNIIDYYNENQDELLYGNKFDKFITKLFKKYIISKFHGIHYKSQGYYEFLDTGLMLTTTKLKYVNK